MNKTTATAAIAFLLLLGVRDIWLGGVDLCYKTRKPYYVDSDPKRSPLVASEVNSIKMGRGLRCTRRQLQMIADMTALKEDIADNGIEASITQGCSYSPMSCFGRCATFEEWICGES